MPKCWSKLVGYCGKPRLLPADGEGGKNVKQGQSHNFLLRRAKRTNASKGTSEYPLLGKCGNPANRRWPANGGRMAGGNSPLVLYLCGDFGWLTSCAITGNVVLTREMQMPWRGLWVSTVLLLSVIQTGAAQNFPAIDAQTGAAPAIVRQKKPVQEMPAQNFQTPAQNFPAIDTQTGAAPRLVPPKNAMQHTPAEHTSEQALTSTAAPTAMGQEKKPAPQDPRAAAAQR